MESEGTLKMEALSKDIRSRGETYFRSILLEWQLTGCDCVKINHRLILQWEIQTANHCTWNSIGPFLERERSEELIRGQVMRLAWNKGFRQNAYLDSFHSVVLR